MSRQFTVGPIIGLHLLAAASVASAASPGQSCTAIDNDADRLACYDQALGRAPTAARSVPAAPVAAGAAVAGATAAAATAGKTATSAPSSAPPSAMSSAEAAAKAQQEFGLTEQAKREMNQTQQEPPPPESVTAKVVGISHRPTGEQIYTLDNGQVWVEIESSSSARSKAGDTVTIRKASLGSYLLVGGNKVAVRVRRVK